jgi:GDP-4-dehydro-6-deoxy-D-mannose reductase
MKVLVTGANGFVGPHMVRALLDAGHTVVAIGHSSANGRLPEGVEKHSLDLTDRKAVDALDFKLIEGVIHLAGMAAVGPSFDAPMQYIQVNGGMELNLFEASQAQGAKPRFVVISSGALYDPKSPLPLTEESAVKASSPYAVSKLLQEELGAYYSLRGFEVVVARPFNHIGPGQAEGFLVPDLAKQIAEAERSGKMTIEVGNLKAKRDFTDVRDIAQGYIALLERGQPGELYNVCSGHSVSGEDVLKGLLALSKKSDLTAKADKAKMRPVDVLDIYGDYGKVKRDAGWQPAIKLEQSLKEALEDWRSKSAE